MKLRYEVPHKVTARMVGPQFVAACSCKQWSKAADPRKYDKLPGAWYPGGVLPDPVEELLAACHRHATDHVMANNGFQRKGAA